jgi:hypothetical protein
MAITALNTSTLSEALTASTNDFTVGSTANITVGDFLVIRRELVKVQEIPVSGRVRVMRGHEGTEARAHASGQRFFILANPEDAKLNSKQQLALVGASGVYPDYLFPGQEADDGAGNRYILLDLTATIYSGVTVKISNDGLYTAAVLVGGTQGRVALTVEQGTSNQWVWAQTRGANSYAQASSATTAATSASVPIACSSLSTPACGLYPATATTDEDYLIHGMWITGIATSATTSATSATGTAVPVYLHDPYVVSFVQDIMDPTS